MKKAGENVQNSVNHKCVVERSRMAATMVAESHSESSSRVPCLMVI